MNSEQSSKNLSSQSAVPERTEDKTIMLEEYKALRNEILKRIEFRYQLILST